MLLFSARGGGARPAYGPRVLVTAGRLVVAAGVLVMLRVGPDASYGTEMLPAAVLFGAGLTLLAAPLAGTVLDSAADRFAGALRG